MAGLRLIFAGAVLILLVGCSVQESLTSYPMGAEIYWGKTAAQVAPANIQTPARRTVAGQELEAWCYQVRKVGYLDSDIVCREATSSDRNIHFDLQPAPQ